MRLVEALAELTVGQIVCTPPHVAVFSDADRIRLQRELRGSPSPIPVSPSPPARAR